MNPNQKHFARRLRKNPSPAESFLWQKLRRRRFGGFKFRRQRAIGPFFADFCCVEKMLIIELDGWQHNKPEAKEYDEARSKFLELTGYTVIRYWDRDLFQDTDNVMRKIHNALNKGKGEDNFPLAQSGAGAPPFPLAGKGGYKAESALLPDAE